MTVIEKQIQFEDDIPEEIFSLRLSLKARWKELRFSIALLRKSPLFILGTFIVFFLVALAVLAPVIAPYGPQERAKDSVAGTLDYLFPPLSEDSRSYLLWSDNNLLDQQFSIDIRNSLATGVKSFVSDLNQDGYKDLVIGTGDGQLVYFKNTGNIGNQIEFVIDESFPMPIIPADLSHVSPTIGDIDASGTLDLLIGVTNATYGTETQDTNAFLLVSRNNGTNLSPEWTDFEVVKDSSNATLSFPKYANPTLYNYNADKGNTLDLLVGTTDGYIHVYSNSNNQTYSFTLLPNAPKGITSTRLFLSNEVGNSLRVQVTFVDNVDDRFDLVIISSTGTIYYYTSFGQTSSPNFVVLNQESEYTGGKFAQFEKKPGMDFQLTDLTTEGFVDIIVFYNNGTILEKHQYFVPDDRIHYLGTDDLGQDIFSRIVWALQVDLVLAMWIVAWSAFVGILVGSIAGFFGGWVDNLFMRFTDIVFAFPGLILAMAISAALGRNLFNLAIALIIVGWAGYARIIRGQVLAEKNKLYVDAARATGLGNIRLISRHILPNCIYPILVAATLDLGGVLLAAAGLSFIGFGAQPSDAELGRMISDGREYIQIAPWLIFFPGIMIAIMVLAFNLIGDGLRDILDPRLRR